MAHAHRPFAQSPMSRPKSRLFLVAFFVVTAILAYVAASAIVRDAGNEELQRQVEAFRERKERNSLFAPADSTAPAPAPAPAGTP